MRTLMIAAILITLALLSVVHTKLPHGALRYSPTQASPAAPDGRFTATAADRATALKILTVTDDGQPVGSPRRWRTDEVTVVVQGAASPSDLAAIDETLSWMTTATGVGFFRTDRLDADVTVTLAPGLAPRAELYFSCDEEDGLLRATAQWDPTGWLADRWRWEELLHTAGPIGDWASPGTSVFVEDTAAHTPTAFDAWLLRTLYTDPSALYGTDAQPRTGPR